MIKMKLLLIIGIFLLILPSVLSASISNIKLEIDENINQIHSEITIINPSPTTDICLEGECITFYGIGSAGWGSLVDNRLYFLNQRPYVWVNSVKNFEYIENCSNLHINSSLNIKFSQSQKGNTLDNVSEDILKFSSLKNKSYSCLYSKSDFFNPNLFPLKTSKLYPFDSYKLDFYTLIPNSHYTTLIIKFPKGFIFNSLNTKPIEIAKIISKDLILVQHFVGVSNNIDSIKYSVSFSRNSIPEKFFLGFFLFLIPLLIIIYFCLTPNLKSANTQGGALKSFYIAIIPLVLICNNLYISKPNVFTLLDVSAFISILFVSFSILKDFLFLKLSKEKRIILSILFCFLMVFIWWIV